jgi:hypothetical protein
MVDVRLCVAASVDCWERAPVDDRLLCCVGITEFIVLLGLEKLPLMLGGGGLLMVLISVVHPVLNDSSYSSGIGLENGSIHYQMTMSRRYPRYLMACTPRDTIGIPQEQRYVSAHAHSPEVQVMK